MNSPLAAAPDWVHLRYVTTKIGSGKTPPGGFEAYVNHGVVFIRSQNVWDTGLRLDDVVYIDGATHRSMQSTRVFPGDVLLNITGASIGRVCVASDTLADANVNQHVCIIRPGKRISGKYLAYALQSAPVRDLIVSKDPGATMEGINFEEIKSLQVPVSDAAQQRAVADFLDRKTAAIDKLITKKERLVALLQEKRQTLIAQAVTRGLTVTHSSGRTTETGLPFLTSLPEEWRMVPLRHLLAFGPKNGISPPSARSGGVLSFAISAVRDGQVQINGYEKWVDVDPLVAREFELKRGDILMMRGSGSLHLVGSCGLVRQIPAGCTYPDTLMRMRPSNRILAEFLVAALNAPYVRTQIEVLAKTSNGTYKVSGEDVRSLQIAVPPYSEQSQIVEQLEGFIAPLHRAEQLAMDSIERLQEYRQALITAAVTGKIDVTQESAPSLPATPSPASIRA